MQEIGWPLDIISPVTRTAPAASDGAIGAGADRPTLDLFAAGPGAGRVVTAGNLLGGGLGRDTLAIAAGTGTGVGAAAGVVVNLGAGWLRIGADRSTLSGFQICMGLSGGDRCADGAGSQTFDGGGGADALVCFAGSQRGPTGCRACPPGTRSCCASPGKR